MAAALAGAVALTYGLLPSSGAGTAASSLPKSLAGRLELAAHERDDVWGVGDAGGGVLYAQSHDAVWLTPDGGRTWRRAPEAVSWAGNIQFVNGRDGWIQEGPWLYRTTEGAGSWTRLPIPSAHVTGTASSLPNFAHDMWFVNRKVGFLSAASDYPHGAAPYRLFATDDGGLTWQVRGPLPSGAFVRQFEDARRGFATSARAELSTMDGGRTWSKIQPPCRGPFEGGRFGGTVQVWQCGASHRHLRATTDGGATWTVRSAPRGTRYLDVLGARTWVARSSDPTRFFVTTSAGRTWTPHRLTAPRHWAVASFGLATHRSGWAIFGREPKGGHGSLFSCTSLDGPIVGEARECKVFTAAVLMRTTDGGLHWTPAGPPKPKGGQRK